MAEQKSATRNWCIVTTILTVLCIGLTIGIIVLAVLYHQEINASSRPQQDASSRPQQDAICSEQPTKSPHPNNSPRSADSPHPTVTKQPETTTSYIDTSEPENPDIFHDLTSAELAYINQNLNASMRDKVHATDLIVPNKQEALDYLAGKGPKPARQARVIFYLTDKSLPVLEEYSVKLGTEKFNLELIDYPNRRNPVEYTNHPPTLYEVYPILTQVDGELGDIMLESYNAKIRNCGNKCLFPLPISVQSSYFEKSQRGLWISFLYHVDYFTLYPVDLMLFVVSSASPPYQTIKKVRYGGQMWDSIDAFKSDYNSGKVNKSTFIFPNVTNDSFSTLNRRGPDPKPFPKKRQPKLVEPDGPRYTIKNRHVEYHDWKFDIRMSTLSGPQLFDVNYLGERIAFEISMQEIATYYYGDAPNLRVSKLIDGSFLLGKNAVSLAKGIDCPETATYLKTAISSFDSRENICVFEQNSGIPLRRHGGRGLVDSYLVVRSVVVLANYDYIVDFVFHQSGILETKVMSTGYIQTSVYWESEKDYGFQLRDRLLGTIHHHLFHFKVDLDIHGTSNRYETLDFKTVNVSNSDWLDSSTGYQTQIIFEPSLKTSELEAAYSFNFETPKEHIIHNNAVKTQFNVSRAYKIQLTGMSKQLLPEGMYGEPTISWSRHQMVVTKRKEEEYTSTSIYAAFDEFDPVVNYAKYIEDDENIVDEDLVLWISLGLIHLPTNEDLPITQTPGKHLSFMLAPHNYFDEDPSMSSYDQK